MKSNIPSSLFPAFSALDSLQIKQAKQWLKLALLSIALSGLAPLLLLAGRASIYAELAMVKTWFVPVLVLHVNLSVGLWFLALTMMLWRLLWPVKLPYGWHMASLLSFLLGILAFIGAPFAGGEAFTSNYIPVQNNAFFFFGLSLILISLLLMIGPYLYHLILSPCGGVQERDNAIGWGGIALTLLTLLTALACFAFSVMQHPDGYGGEPYYEAIWWGGGHVLQFTYVQIAMISWLWLAEKLDLKLPPRNWIFAGFTLLTVGALLSPIIYWLEDINSYYHIKFFSWQMNIVTGTIPGLLALWLFVALVCKFRETTRNALYYSLLMSVLLFLSGGLVGYLIEGSNTIIPAHYHGSTVGVTLALMGLAYLLLPVFGGREVLQWKSAKWQPVLYGMGQLLHVIGFAIAGTQGAGRKMAGKMENATELAEMGMQLVRLGGILAVIGGGLFVVVMLRGFRCDSR